MAAIPAPRNTRVMFEELLLGGETGRSIALETHLGNPIVNDIAPIAGAREHRLYETLRQRCGQSWVNRKPATGIYNCFGMVFASRRTSIYDEDGQQLTRILDDDGFRKLPDQTDVHPGDVVLYRDRASGEVFHAAIVTRLEAICSDTGAVADGTIARSCYCLSKWNDRLGEDEHHLRHHCWEDTDLAIEFWTERPL